MTDPTNQERSDILALARTMNMDVASPESSERVAGRLAVLAVLVTLRPKDQETLRPAAWPGGWLTARWVRRADGFGRGEAAGLW